MKKKRVTMYCYSIDCTTLLKLDEFIYLDEIKDKYNFIIKYLIDIQIGQKENERKVQKK